jgi:uncharacterized protein YciI
MLFALLCTDKPASLEVRLKNRPDHLAFLSALGAQVKLAGPFLDDDGKPTGSLVIIEAETLAEARAMAEADPYARAGLFASVEIKAWKWVVNAPEAA